MQWLLNCKSKDIPMSGVDWIVLSANALGVAIVVLATLHANGTATQYAQTTPPHAVEFASLY